VLTVIAPQKYDSVVNISEYFQVLAW